MRLYSAALAVRSETPMDGFWNQLRISRRAHGWAWLWPALILFAPGCMLGPRELEKSRLPYNEAVKESGDEQLLLNLVRMRYNEDLQQIDVASIAAQYETNATAEARPFFVAPNPSNSNVIFRTFTSILPALSASAANRPTISYTPLDDPEN